MKTKKLIRDNIPEIIEKNWGKADCYVAGEVEYRDELFRKFLEEAEEVVAEKNNKEKLKEEIWDLLEVLEAVLKLENIEMSEILEIKEEKKKKNWWFDKRIILNMGLIDVNEPAENVLNYLNKSIK